MADRPIEPADNTEVDADSDFRAMLAGIRTTLPGSQVLLGFLMTVPLQARFDTLTGFTRIAFLVALVTAALSSILLIAPSAQARVRYPVSGIRRQTPGHIRLASRIALCGTLMLLIAIVASMLFSLSLVVSAPTTTAIVAVIAVTATTTWIGMPLYWTFSERSDESL